MNSVFQIFFLLADWLTYGVFDLTPGSKLADSVHFFIYDTTKILVLILIIIYAVSWLRAKLDSDKIRTYLQGKNRFFAYILASGFGAITPFCSCSSIPLFLGFTAARIPVGITMAFLITSPIINEVALLLLGSILGFKFMVAYLVIGITAGVIGGFFFDLIKAERYIKMAPTPAPGLAMAGGGGCCGGASVSEEPVQSNWAFRHAFAKEETRKVFTKVWKWVLVGIAIGAIFHGYVPEEWVAQNLGSASWWTVPIASILGIPLYADATSIIPIAQSMLAKGVPIGTMLTFMMSVVGASFPEFILLKQVMQTKMLILLFGLLLILFTLTGWLFNAIAPMIGL